jgi:L-fuculose-phosphate aldolase
MIAMDERALRQSIVDHCIGMNGSGLNQGTSGNISARFGDSMLITPSGRPYATMKADDLAVMPIDGEYGTWSGPFKPSSEWMFHLDIMKSRPDVGAIVHTHSTFATILAMLRKPIPACHYMIAAFGGSDVRCGGYARYGTKELSAEALKALEGRTGCLLANHGMIAVAGTLEKAMWTAIELETIAKQYYHALLIGGPVILSEAQIEETLKAVATYGLQTDKASPSRS